uniref:hypothetical protein n=1 Tax=uncultured Agitococcus sp. TaxID=1506599 RepID=UPI00345B9BCD
MLVKLILTGYLKDFVPKGEIFVDAFNARDALMKAGNQLPKGATHQVKVAELPCVDSLQENFEVLTIQPIYQGSGGDNKKAGGIQIGLGVLLIAFSGGAAFAALGLSKGAVILTGAQLILGGALQLLQKSPKADLEKGKMTSLLMGMVVGLAILFVAFEWSNAVNPLSTGAVVACTNQPVVGMLNSAQSNLG